MKITLHEISVRDLSDGFIDKNEEGVFGYKGNLDIRPAYQREFVYKDSDRDAVVNTVVNNFPLNVMYWAVNGDRYEVLDGQQRSISICRYVHDDFTFEHKLFSNLTEEEKNQILDYKLQIYFCDGSPKERLEWFKVINIAGKSLNDQELRNASYTGEWLTDAKKFFCKKDCVAYKVGSDYMNGSVERQDYLEKVLKWASAKEHIDIEDYMAIHQHDQNAAPLYRYFNSVCTWVDTLFEKKAKLQKNVEWGILYNEYGNKDFDTGFLKSEVKRLIEDDDVTSKSGIYSYLITGKEKFLSIRKFGIGDRLAAYEAQGGMCPICGGYFKEEDMEADHKIPWSKGGHTIRENCQMLCVSCNRQKSDK